MTYTPRRHRNPEKEIEVSLTGYLHGTEFFGGKYKKGYKGGYLQLKGDPDALAKLEHTLNQCPDCKVLLWADEGSRDATLLYEARDAIKDKK